MDGFSRGIVDPYKRSATIDLDRVLIPLGIVLDIAISTPSLIVRLKTFVLKDTKRLEAST